MICPIELTHEVSDLSGGGQGYMTLYEANDTGRSGTAMTLQDVMLRAMAKQITWYQAAEILGISCRADAALAYPV